MEVEKPTKTIKELEEQFGVRDTPENRMQILHDINQRKGEIASEKREIASVIVSTLCHEQLTVNEAISILKSAEGMIMQSRFTI